ARARRPRRGRRDHRTAAKRVDRDASARSEVSAFVVVAAAVLVTVELDVDAAATAAAGTAPAANGGLLFRFLLHVLELARLGLVLLGGRLARDELFAEGRRQRLLTRVCRLDQRRSDADGRRQNRGREDSLPMLDHCGSCSGPTAGRGLAQ